MGDAERGRDGSLQGDRIAAEAARGAVVTPRRALRRLLPLIVGATIAWPSGAAGSSIGGEGAEGAAVSPVVAGSAATLSQLVGQKLVVAMSGTTPSADLLGRISRGEVGGIILFGQNITGAAQLRALVQRLRTAAAGGGQPPLLIATDQEGGSVKRVGWAPPTLSPPLMGSTGSTTTASDQGKATGLALLCAGVDADLAPVADVPSSTSSFMYRQGRTWSFSASATAALSDAFASGLNLAHVAPTMKHFPGIGFAALDTDSNVVTISATRDALAPGLLPYQKAIADGLPLVMLSNATYPAYDGANAAGWSHEIAVGLLRTTLGFRGVSMTDSLTGTAAARGVSATSLAERAAKAGTDMIMLTGSEESTRATYASLLLAAQGGSIPLATLQASYGRILALKGTLAAPTPDATAPTVSAPISTLYAPSTLGSTTVPVRTSWIAKDPCGISGYLLERSVGGGTWAGRALSSPTATSTAESLTAASVYRYALRATDGAGNVSGRAYGASLEPLVRQQSSVVRYGGTWGTASSTGYTGGTIAFTLAAGAWASYTFSGTSIAWVTAVGPTRGSAKVYLDGTYAATVNLYASTTALRRIAYAHAWTSQATHTIRIVAVGTTGHPRVDVDAFVRLYRP